MAAEPKFPLTEQVQKFLSLARSDYEREVLIETLNGYMTEESRRFLTRAWVTGVLVGRDVKEPYQFADELFRSLEE